MNMDHPERPDGATPPAATALAFTRVNDAPAVWIGYSDGGLTLLGERGELVSRWHPPELSAAQAVTCLAVSPSGRRSLAGNAAGEVFVWHGAEGRSIDRFTCPEPVVQAAILKDATYVTVDGWRNGLIWHKGTGDTLRPTPIASNGESAFPFDAFGVLPGGDRLTLIAALDWSVWWRDGNHVGETHSMAEGERLAYLDGFAGVSANGIFCYLYWDDCTVFNVRTGEVAACGPRLLPATAAALSNNGRRLLLGTANGELASVHPRGRFHWRVEVSGASISKVVLDPLGTAVGWIDEEGRCGVVDTADGHVLWPRA